MKGKAKAKSRQVRRKLSFGPKVEQKSQADDGLFQVESAEAHGVPQAENAPEQLQPAELPRHGPGEFQSRACYCSTTFGGIATRPTC